MTQKEHIRKLASIQQIIDIKPIVGADLICAYQINGWWVVDQVGKYQVGELAIYCEIDSFIPTNIAPFLSKGRAPREYLGVEGERLRTIKLKGHLSQGLLLPTSNLDRFDADENTWYWGHQEWSEGDDVTEELGIQKWEAPIDARLAGFAKGNWPQFIQKTDQARCISGDTVVDTVTGKFTIKEIVDNKMQLDVYCYNHETNIVELKPIIDWSVMTRRNNWIKITMKSGKELLCTTNHKIWCNDILAYRNAEDIIIGQQFIKRLNTNRSFI